MAEQSGSLTHAERWLLAVDQADFLNAAAALSIRERS
jgi:hypothetical protein